MFDKKELEKIKKSPGAKPLKAIILGCTHYPFYTHVFQTKLEHLYNYQENDKYIYRSIMANHIEFIDPALYTAKELYDFLAASRLFNEKNLLDSEFYISIPNQLNQHIKTDASGMFSYNYKYGRKAGDIQEYVKRVPFSNNCISPQVIQRFSKSIPMVFELISNFNQSNTKTKYLKPEEKIKIK